MDNQITISWIRLKKMSNFVEHLKGCDDLENVKFVFDGDRIQSIKIVTLAYAFSEQIPIYGFDKGCDEDCDEDD